MATLQFRRGTAFIDPQVGEPFLDTNINGLKIGIGGSDFITLLSSSSLDSSISGFDSRLDNIELTTASLNTSVSNLNSFTQSFNTAISLDSSNVTILGDLDVQGTTTTIDSTTITLGDNIIELNGTGEANGGILVNDVTNPNTLSGSLLWDGTNDYWKAGQLGSESEIITTNNIVSNLPTGTISGSSQITITESQISDLSHTDITSLNSYTASNDTTNTNQNSSLNNLNSYTASNDTTNTTQNQRLSALESFTGSIDDGYVTEAELAAATGALETADSLLQSRANNLESFTSSIDTTIKTKLDSDGVISGSSQVDVTQTTNYSSINQYTDSDTQDYIDSIGVVSGSVSGQLPSGTVSGSSQIDHDQTLNFSTDEHFTQENITTLGTVTVGSVTAILPSGTVSGSSQINIIGGLPSGIVSGSEQIDHDSTLNFSPAEHFTQENITTLGTVTVGSVSGILPTGTISGSSQVDVTQTTNYSSINQYTDSDTQNYIDSIGLVSGSVSGQLPTGTVSGSSQIDVTQTTNYSSINQYTDSDTQGYIDDVGVLSGSSQVNMGGDISGDASNATVEKVQGVSLTSGEVTQLGNIDTHTISNTQWGYLGVMNQNVRTTDNVTFNTGSFTGDVTINGNFTVLGSATEISTTELTVEDKLITIASGSADSAAANGAGIYIDGANESITWDHSNSRFNISDDLNVEGNVTATGDVVAFSSSDRRFKDNLTKISTPLTKLSKINGYSFNWNNDNQHIYKGKDYGVVAQEIQEVLPELVQERENGYLAVNYEKLVPLLIESIKELKTQVEHLNKKKLEK